MSDALVTLKGLFCADSLRDALNERLADANLPTLAAVPIARHPRLLRSAARYPALAVELGQVSGQLEGSGGLSSLRGVATWWLAAGAAGEAVVLERLEAMLDALREGLAAELAGQLDRFTLAAAGVEGELWQEGSVALRLAPLRFDFVWLYEPDTTTGES